MKRVPGCLSTRKSRASSFLNFRGPVRLVQACLCVKSLKAVFTTVESCDARQACLNAGTS